MPSVSLNEKRGDGVHVQMETFASVTEAPSNTTLVQYGMGSGDDSLKPSPTETYAADDKLYKGVKEDADYYDAA